MTSEQNRCEYVIRRAGRTVDGRPLDTVYGGGATTEYCGKPGRAVSHTFKTKRPGTTNVYDTFEDTTIRCPEHIDIP